MNFQVGSELAREKLHAASQLKQKQNEQKQQEQVIKQDPSLTTGVQWAYAQAPQAVQAQAAAQKAEGQTIQNQPRAPEVATPDIEDLAAISTTVSVKEEAVQAINDNRSIFSHIRTALNAGALEQSFKEIYKKSKSHNLLLERFMATVKLSGIGLLLSACGISAEQLENIKAEVREQTLKEIELKLSQDWAYAKALIEIMG